MATAKDVLKVAASQLGYKEGSNNNNKYGQAYGLNNAAWCVIFLWWVFKQAGASALFYGGGRIALCSALYNYHKGKGQAVSKTALQPGDVVFYNFSGGSSTQHVGIVEAVSGSTITAIEGNTSSGTSGSQSNGDGVYRRQRSIKHIVAAYRPAYNGAKATGGWSQENFVREIQSRIGAGVDGIAGTETLGKAPEISKDKNAGHAVVAAIQTYLFSQGYKLPEYGADGDYGTETETAVKEYQKATGLEQDGIIGQATWKKLLGL